MSPHELLGMWLKLSAEPPNVHISAWQITCVEIVVLRCIPISFNEMSLSVGVLFHLTCYERDQLFGNILLRI